MILPEKIFLHVLYLSWTGSLVILAVLLLRCMLHQMPKKFSYVLWAIPAVRLLVIISFCGIVRLPEQLVSPEVQPALSSVIDASALLPGFVGEAADTVPEGGEAADTVPEGGPAYIVPEGGAAADTVPEDGPARIPETGSPSLWLAPACLWLAGMIVFAAKNGYDFYRLRKKLRVCMRWKKYIYLVDGIAQPFVLAGLPGKIYLPSGLCEEKRRYILMHEQVHLRRGDAFFKLIASLICCVHWFNPIVWLGVHCFNRDMEMSCDEAAVSRLNAAEKQAYAQELLHFSVRKKGQLQVPCTFGERGVKGRIMNLSKKKRKSKLSCALAGGVVVFAAVVLVPNFWSMAQEPGGHLGDNSGLYQKKADGDAGNNDGPFREKEGASGTGGEIIDGAGNNTEVSGQKKEESGKEITDSAGILEKSILINGVPVSMRWHADAYSEEDMETLAGMVYDSFADVYLEGKRRPEQMYGLDEISCDTGTADDLLNLFSGTENPMVWRLFVTLPDNWREDKGMGMMQSEESQKQEYDIALVKNAAGIWEVAESAWRVYYDSAGNFRWDE